jgi:Zn-dependent protease with chaperone function
MNFFERQDQARRNTRRLVLLFAAAVVAIVVAVYLAAFLAFGYVEVKSGEGVPAPWNGTLLLWVALGTLGMISAGSLYKTVALSGGGSRVASLLGGREVDPHTTDAAERRLLNIVEEMAIASGMPVPTVYVLGSEDAINAFAAGFNPGDAVVAVTRGALDRLDRDELQGVIAHEFSHIAWGDMRLNLRLMGLLHGILLLGLTGEMILRFGPRGGGGGGRKKGGGGAILLFGLALLVIGYVGVFFGRMIKSGISRQREFLADAAAVQFTRNPQGLAGALAKIASTPRTSVLETSRAEEASHLFFANGLKSRAAGWLSTHPPLLERIRRIDPEAAARLEAEDLEAPAETAYASPEDELTPALAGPPGAPPSPPAAAEAATSAPPAPLDPAAWTESLGAPTAEHLAYTSALLKGLSPALDEAARHPASARALIYALLLDRDPELRQRQLEELGGSLAKEATAGEEILGRTRELAPQVDATPAEARLPLVDLALPALRRLSEDGFAAFRRQTHRLAEADGEVSLFELALEQALLRHLDHHFRPAEAGKARYRSLIPLGRPTSILLSALAHTGYREPQDVTLAFEAAAAELRGTGARLELLAAGETGFDALGDALSDLAAVSPPLKQRLLTAAAAGVLYDKRVTVEEGELLRAVADALGVPAPPLLPGGG